VRPIERLNQHPAPESPCLSRRLPVLESPSRLAVPSARSTVHTVRSALPVGQTNGPSLQGSRRNSRTARSATAAFRDHRALARCVAALTGRQAQPGGPRGSISKFHVVARRRGTQSMSTRRKKSSPLQCELPADGRGGPDRTAEVRGSLWARLTTRFPNTFRPAAVHALRSAARRAFPTGSDRDRFAQGSPRDACTARLSVEPSTFQGLGCRHPPGENPRANFTEGATRRKPSRITLHPMALHHDVLRGHRRNHRAARTIARGASRALTAALLIQASPTVAGTSCAARAFHAAARVLLPFSPGAGTPSPATAASRALARHVNPSFSARPPSPAGPRRATR
jgi:hypothetical protein